MPVFAEHREVRVTARESCKTPFIAPDQAPVRLLDRELEKGLKGWTDFDVKVPVDPRTELIKARQAALVEDITITGDVVTRKAPASKARVRHPRPTKRRWA